MTEDDLAAMELMWLRRVPVKMIAERLGYGVSTIQSYARRIVGDFPEDTGQSTRMQYGLL